MPRQISLPRQLNVSLTIVSVAAICAVGWVAAFELLSLVLPR